MITASAINDRIFLAFPAGWIVGVLAGSIWAGVHWDSLKPELGRTLLIAVTVSQAVTLILTMIILRRMFPTPPAEIHDDEE